MLKPYRDEFVSDLNAIVHVHPSTKLFAHFSKNIDAAIVTTAIFLCFSLLLSILSASFFAVWLALMGLVWYWYLMVIAIKSYKVIRKHYNQYLFPIEVAFNAMKPVDQKRYADVLKNAYAICSRGYPDEFGELKKIRELFELTAPADKILSLDEEISLKKKQLKEKEEYDKYIQGIVDEFK